MNRRDDLRLEPLGEDEGFLLYRGTAGRAGAPVLLRVATTLDGGVRLEHEHRLRDELDPVWAARPLDLVEIDHRRALLLEDPGGEPVDRIAGRPLAVEDVLHFGIAAAAALAGLHRCGLIHRDVRPATILYDRERACARLTSFGITVRAEHEPAAEALGSPAASLAYMAPERTERVSRPVDSRSDLYALGVILYQLLTGELPFAAVEPMEWIHCHIARQPVPPAERGAEVPAALSDLVMKLLAKSADERYQTATGLEADLRHCLSALHATGGIPRFRLGCRDTVYRLQIPERLYGRGEEIAALLGAFERVAAGGRAGVVLVSGYSGVGKSAVVHELRKALGTSRGQFVAGKFDQYRGEVPYATVAQALRALVGDLLGRSETELAAWRQAIDAALGGKGALLVDLLPELELVIGPQPPLQRLAPREDESRFHTVFRRFVSVFARREHPLVLFLDDLQWSDAASLELLAALAAHPDTGSLLMVGAYRDNEVGPSHPLRHTVAGLQGSGVRVEEIVLGPLGRADLGRLVADALGSVPAAVKPLTRLVHEKTDGNPFFAIQLLTEMADEGLIVHDGSGGWHWDLAGAGAKRFSDNVAELMAGRLRRLSRRCRAALAYLASFGHRADAVTLAVVRTCPVDEVHGDLAEAVQAGMVVRDEESYHFAHDRIQEAAYALVAPADRAARHLAIARRLAEDAAAGGAERSFDLANHFNRGAALIESRAEREYAAAVNAAAGRKARTAIAYGAARTYLGQAVDLLAEDAWSARYEETFALHLELAESEYLDGELDAAEARFAALLPRARGELDCARIHRLRQRLYQAAGRFHDAVAATVEALRLLGVVLPADEASIRDAARARKDEIASALESCPVAELSGLPAATDPVACMAIGLLGDALVAVYNARPAAFALFAATGVSLSLRHGNALESGACYSGYALVLVSGDEVVTGYAFSRLAMGLDERLGAAQQRPVNLIRHGLFIEHRRRPYVAALEWFDRAERAAMETGDFVSASQSAPARLALVLASGVPLAGVLAEARSAAELTRTSHSPALSESIRVVQQFIACLQGRTRGPASLEGDGYSEGDSSACMAAAGWSFGVGMLHASKLAAAVYYGACSESLVAAAEQALPGIAASIPERLCRFYRALALLELYPDASPERQGEYRSELQAELMRFRRWAEDCVENFSACEALIGAELARLEGRELDAMRAFEAAIDSARDHGLTPYEALACERAGRFYLDRGLATNAMAHLQRARACYARWGAEGKVRQFDERYPALRPPQRRAGDAVGGAVADLDVSTVVKASQAVSGEIVLERLIATLMEIAVEHAGADRGVLVLLHGDTFHTTAVAEVGREGLEVRLCSKLVSGDDLPEGLLNYVLRTRESLILDDALATHFQQGNAYIRHHRPRSVLYLPLLKQGEPMGLLYLENRLAPGIFTRARLAVLEVLAAQAAISIANATLFAELQEENAGRRRAEAARQESRVLLDSIIHNVPAVIFVKDLEGRYLLVNRRHEELYEVPSEALAGRTDYDLFSREVADQLREDDRAAIEKGEAIEVEETVPGVSGERTYLVVKCPLFDAAGQPYAVCGIATDITERKQAEADRRARLAAEAASRAKTEFLSRMSHELRTPLNAILGYAQILARDPGLEERQTAGLGTILKSGQHLLSLIDDLLDLAKIEAGKLDLAPAPLALEPFLAGVTDIIRVKTEGKGLQFLYEAPEGLPAAVMADEKRLRQVLLNLLGNAVKYTDRGRVGFTVRQMACVDDGQAMIRLSFEVSDSGIGIAEEALGRIFQPFEQAGEARRRAVGTGLGLSISRELVGMMGAEIQVESTLGMGSRFWFQLELARASLPVPESVAGGAPPGTGADNDGRLAAPRLATERLEAPPPEEIAALHRLALVGNMRDIADRASLLANTDERYRAFAEHLMHLARGYESKAILALVERFRGKAVAPPTP